MDIKRVPHMMLMPYNYPYASAAASSPYDSTSEDRRRKRTPFYLPSVTGRSSSPRGMRFYKNNWFKRDSTAGSEDDEPGQSVQLNASKISVGNKRQLLQSQWKESEGQFISYPRHHQYTKTRTLK